MILIVVLASFLVELNMSMKIEYLHALWGIRGLLLNGSQADECDTVALSPIPLVKRECITMRLPQSTRA